MLRRSWELVRSLGTDQFSSDRGRPAVSDRKYWTWVGERWLPFVGELRAELRAVEARAALGFADNEHLPAEAQILEWGRRAIALTEEVRGYGNGTPNVVFQVLMRMGQYNGIARYRFEQIPTALSHDGFVRVIDGAARSSLYSHGGQAVGIPASPDPGRDRALGTAVDAGGELRQSVEESAIANTFISGIMSERDAHVLIVGALLRRLLLRVVRRRGVALLIAMAGAAEGEAQELLWRLAEPGRLPSKADADAARALFRRVDAALQRGAARRTRTDAPSAGASLAEASDESLARACESVGVGRDSATWQAMVLWGVAPQSYGQLAPETKLQAVHFTAAAIDESRRKAGRGPESLDPKTAEFINFLREHPGSLWHGDRNAHLLMLTAGLLSKSIVYMSRDEIDRRTCHRYLPVKWTRTLPLLEGVPDGLPVVRREVGTEEISRFRFNAFPYDDEHGLGLGKPSGWEPDALDPLRLHGERRRGLQRGQPSAAHVGEALVIDAGAKLGNWFISDIEKILAEFATLNMRGTRGARHRLLPGEAPVMVGQNPRAASSIGATQHTQLSTASVGKWPLFRLRAPLVAAGDSDGRTRHRHALGGGIRAQVELVQVGRQEDAVLLRLELGAVEWARHWAVLQLLHGARQELMTAFGGRAVDFNLLAAAQLPQTGAVVVLAPLAMVEPAREDRNVWVNPDTGERSDAFGLPVQTVDFSQGRGNWMLRDGALWAAAVERGRDLLGGLYDFARKPGARALLALYLAARLPGWRDSPGRALLEPLCAAAHQSADAFWDAGRLLEAPARLSRL